MQEMVADEIWFHYLQGEIYTARRASLKHYRHLDPVERERMRMIFLIHWGNRRFLTEKEFRLRDPILAEAAVRINDALLQDQMAYVPGNASHSAVMQLTPVYLWQCRYRELEPGECLWVEHCFMKIDELDVDSIDWQEVSSWEVQALYFYARVRGYHELAEQLAELHYENFPISDFTEVMRLVDLHKSVRGVDPHVVYRPIAYSFIFLPLANGMIGRPFTAFDRIRMFLMMIPMRLYLNRWSLWKVANY
ncbi:hypothetical protein CCB81_12850 [Armatimonadetes bacterium Uphvl-Ar2]|nr:hypothetical protein CCB81_12850 [Armatimonadetes bacterium Uphvl-Ar2]